MNNLRFPNITANDQGGQLAQVKSYLFQLVEELNWALETVGGGNQSNVSVFPKNTAVSQKSEDPAVSFNELKSLIIKSADIVNAYYQQINKRLEGVYVAQSDFGTFAEQTSNDITINSTAINQVYTDLQMISDTTEKLESSVINVNAYIRTGLLYYDGSGAPVYGVEIGQQTEIDNVDTFNKYARFTASKLSFYDQNGIEVAYISDRKLFIRDVEVTSTYRIGNLVDTVLSDGSVVTR